MNNESLDYNTTIKILKYGTYYNPAHTHYSFAKVTSIVCDRCYRQNLDMCIGYDTYDLCLNCVQDVNNALNKTPTIQQGGDKEHKNTLPEIRTKMMQSMFDKINDTQPQIQTKMMQNMFIDNKKPFREIGSMMMQEMFNKTNSCVGDTCTKTEPVSAINNKDNDDDYHNCSSEMMPFDLFG